MYIVISSRFYGLESKDKMQSCKSNEKNEVATLLFNIIFNIE